MTPKLKKIIFIPIFIIFVLIIITRIPIDIDAFSEMNAKELKSHLDNNSAQIFNDGSRTYREWGSFGADELWIYEWDGNYFVAWTERDKSYWEGKHIFHYGDVYEGQFRNPNGFIEPPEVMSAHGQGVKTYANGDRYEGEWAYGHYEGQGVKVYANGDRYEGEWVYGRYGGQGVKTYANGDRYEGEWSASHNARLVGFDHYKGQGALTLIDGRIYEGLWSYDDALEMHLLDNENDLLSQVFENRSFMGFKKKKKEISNIGKIKGENIYVNACGYDPQSYSLTPFSIEGVITEVPNTVYSLSKSPYGRPIIVGAQSEIELPNKKKLTAILQNFRDFSIVDEFGEVLNHRVSGASSIYEIKKNGKIVGWGVGWNRDCYPYGATTFTAFRIFIPYWNENDFGIDERLIQANVKEYLKAYNESDALILIDTDTIPGIPRAAFCYYCGVNFLKIDNIHGITDLTSIEDLYKHNIDPYKINPLLIAYWYSAVYLRQENIVEPLTKYKRYIEENYKLIIKDAVENFYFSESIALHDAKVTDDYGNSIFKRTQEEIKAIAYYGTDVFHSIKKIAPFFRKWAELYPPNIIEDRLVTYYEENCDIESLNSIKMIADVCFPAHSALMYDIFSEYMSPIEGLWEETFKGMEFQ